jgi:hypothetical protein
MDPQRWQEIEKLYHSVLAREPAERATFLKEACAGDSAMLREIESLLAHQTEAENFIEAPALEVAAKGSWGIELSQRSSFQANTQVTPQSGKPSPTIALSRSLEKEAWGRLQSSGRETRTTGRSQVFPTSFQS